jgi:hypothetical protein
MFIINRIENEKQVVKRLVPRIESLQMLGTGFLGTTVLHFDPNYVWSDRKEPIHESRNTPSCVESGISDPNLYRELLLFAFP